MKNMKYALLMLMIAPFTALAQISTSNSLSIHVRGEASALGEEARLSFLQACETYRSSVLSSAAGPYILSAQCKEGVAEEKLATVRITGSMEVKFTRPLAVEVYPIDSGYARTEAAAREVFDQKCASWGSAAGASRPARVLFENCGFPEADRFYEKIRVTGVAIRLQKVRVPFRQNTYCSCRTRIEPVEGRRHRDRTVYDLMVLNDEGFSQPRGTFTSHASCSDAMNLNPSCTDE